MLVPKIVVLPEIKLVGKSIRMSLVHDKTAELWRNFMPIRKAVKNVTNTDLYSIQVYDESLVFKNFTPQTEFTKCAMVEVSSFEDIPENMETRILKSGLYAVFLYKGLAKDFPKMASLIFNKWLPNSNYELDKRPHFELLGEKYNPNNANSEEEIWIPIKELGKN